MSTNANVNTAVAGTPSLKNYAGTVTAVTAIILKSRNLLNKVQGRIWSTMVENFGGFTKLEFDACSKEIKAHLKEADFNDKSVDTMFSCISKHLKNGAEIPNQWTLAKNSWATLVKAEKENGTADGRGTYERKSEAEGEAQDVGAGDTASVADAKLNDARLLADPIGTMLLSLKAKIAALVARGLSLDNIEAELAETLAMLADTVPEQQGVIIDDGEEEVQQGDFEPELVAAAEALLNDDANRAAA